MVYRRTLGALVLMVMTVAHVHGQGKVTPLGASDYTALEGLGTRGFHALWTGDPAAFAATFTADGVLEQPGLTARGSSAIAAAAAAAPRRRHWVTNLWLRSVEGGAEGWAYVTQSDGAAFLQGGLYHDEFIKGPQGWRIRKRTYMPGTTWPGANIPALPPSVNQTSRLSPSDYWEMRNLVSVYNLGYDNAGPFDQGRLSVRGFHPDAVFERIGAITRTGLDMVADQSTSHKPLLHHWDASFLVSPISDTEAESFGYDMQFNVEEGGAPVSLNAAGVLVHRFRRTPDGWRIVFRRYEAVGATPGVHFPDEAFVPFVSKLGPEYRKAGPGLSEADRIDLDQLYIRSSLGLDSGFHEGRDFAGTFVGDGVLVHPGGRAAGGAALAAWAAAQAPGMHTWTSNVHVEAGPDGTVRGRSHLLTMRITGEAPDVTASSIRAVASTEDVIVRTPAGWRFKERRIVNGK